MRPTAAARSFASRLWRSAAICGLHLPLTIVYPVIVLVLFVLSIALLPLFLLGLPLLGVTFAVMRAFASAERGRMRGVLGVSVEAPTRRRRAGGAEFSTTCAPLRPGGNSVTS